MRYLELLVCLLGVTPQVGASPAGPRPGSGGQSQKYSGNIDRAGAVKAAFQRAWDGYYKYAFPHDSLRPISNTYEDDRNGWGASAVDAFSTAIVMQNQQVIDQILAFVPTIDFDQTSSDVSVFETTIRYLGGLLAAYDLLDGPLKQFANGTSSTAAVLKQAKRLADNLKVAFNTPSGVPDNGVTFGPPRRDGSNTTGLATAGSLVLEWTRLSDLTGDPEYAQLAQKGESYLLNPQPASSEPFPGLLGTTIDLSTGQFLDSSGGWVGGDDSFYEYLIKMYVYDPKRFASYKDRWVKAVESSIKYLASHPSTRPDLTFLAQYTNTSLIYQSQHLACFDGGNFILGGLVLDNPSYVDFGLELVASCHDTYVSTATRIGPEVFQWVDSRQTGSGGNKSSAAPGPPADDAAFYSMAGFWINAADYVLRPEVIESYYYAYRATGDSMYQDWAWDAFVAINRTCSAGSGFSGINDVNTPGGGGFDDFQESFLFAEVMKYSYLIHAEDGPYQVQRSGNQFVFNTEAHPLRVYG